jgi:hypothetical protein
MFTDIADDGHDEDSVKTLLENTGLIPLAISLMANIAGYEGCDKTLARWEKESTRLLSDGYDQRSSLDISIMLSYSGPRMHRGAQELLGLLSMLPDGLSDAELIHSRLPIMNILTCKATLIQVSLAYIDPTGNIPSRLKSLVPIRESIRGAYPPSSILMDCVRHYYHQILRLQSPGLRPMKQDHFLQIQHSFGNCHNILSHALSVPEECGDMEEILDSVIHLNAFMRKAGVGDSQLIQKAGSYMGAHLLSSKHRFYFVELLSSPTITFDPQTVDLGNQAFEKASPEEKGEIEESICSRIFSQRAQGNGIVQLQPNMYANRILQWPFTIMKRHWTCWIAVAPYILQFCQR